MVDLTSTPCPKCKEDSLTIKFISDGTKWEAAGDFFVFCVNCGYIEKTWKFEELIAKKQIPTTQ